jgi:hypothetical protein
LAWFWVTPPHRTNEGRVERWRACFEAAGRGAVRGTVLVKGLESRVD